MPRFVVLEHDSPRGRHWDLMLQIGPTLATWALASPPEPGRPIPAEPLADHRLAYLEYEGPLSGVRGTVARWDTGVYRLERRNEAELVVVLEGGKLRGRATLTRPQDPSGRWTFLLAAADGA
jgi:hypothetical protein